MRRVPSLRPVEDPESAQPPVAPLPVVPRVSRLRWFVYLILLGSYPLLIGVLGGASKSADEESQGPALSGDPVVLITGVLFQLIFFSSVFGLAWWSSRVDIKQLLRWGKGLGPIWRGFLYSIALRLLVLIVVVSAALVAYAVGGLDENSLSELRPKVENTIDMDELAESPVYLFLNVTLVSFVLAGFTEELWRIGVFTGLATLFPSLFRSLPGKAAAVVMVAVVFGLGHISQGAGGVMITTVLGIGLGVIILVHGSVWDAVIAHGCLDASTFVLLYVLLRYFPRPQSGVQLE